MDGSIDLAYPFRGRWLVQNSPANRVPSHGTDAFATAYAIDFVSVDERGRSARITAQSLFHPDPAERFPGFRRPILAPIDGRIVAASSTQPDHPAYRGFPSIGYALSQRRRIQAGWPALAGNHVFLETAEGIIVALCHLQQASITAKIGDRIHTGEPIARCGNSGNSTEPHLHIQAIDTADIARARAVPMTFNGALPRNGDVVTAR